MAIDQSLNSAQSQFSTNSRSYTSGEEIAHAITHGIGIVFAIICLTLCVSYSALNGDVRHILTTSLFGTTLILMYTTSTLYHSIPLPRAKHVLKILDHSAIFLLIAGTITPFALVTLGDGLGWTLFALSWIVAIGGIIFKTCFKSRFKMSSTIMYILFGWTSLVAIKPLSDALSKEGLLWVILGGVFYTVGVIFYVWKKKPYTHVIWHLFVLAGSACHFFAIFFHVIP